MQKAGQKPVIYVLMHGNPDIVKYRKIPEQPDILKGPRNACLADVVGLLSFQGNFPAGCCKGYGPLIRRIHAGQQVKHRGFTRTIGPDETNQLSLFQFHADIGNSHQSAKGFCQFFYI